MSLDPAIFVACRPWSLEVTEILCRPIRAYFGEKDAQQLAVIQKMVADLNMPVTSVPVGTVREADGLALSSRNRLLSAEEREQAPLVYRALQIARMHRS